MFCAATSKSQTISIKEKLPNGEYIVVIDGQEQRTITTEHARQIEQRKIDLDAANKSLELAFRKAELDALEIVLLKAERDSYMSLYSNEKSLRIAAENLNGGKTAGFFNNPIIQVLTKAAVPITTMLLSSKSKQ